MLSKKKTECIAMILSLISSATAIAVEQRNRIDEAANMIQMISDEEDDYGEIIDLWLCCFKEERSRITSYMSVIHEMSDKQFQDNFRLNSETFHFVLDLYENYTTKNKFKPSLPNDKQLLIFLEYLVNGSKTLREIAMLFGCGEATVLRVLRRWSDFFCRPDIISKFVKWPDAERLENIKVGFEKFAGIKNVVGAIDGSHIPIKRPHHYQESYYNRKGFHSIVLQAVCDHELIFTDVFAGWPGAVHDSTILQHSNLFDKMSDPNSFPGDTHLLGDKAYPLMSQLITPYREGVDLSSSVSKQNFNYCHSVTRIQIERAFGTLKGRFRRFMYTIDMDSMERIVKLVLSGVLLHNVAVKKDKPEILEQYFLESQGNVELMNTSGAEDSSTRGSQINRTANLKRDNIMTSLCN